MLSRFFIFFPLSWSLFVHFFLLNTKLRYMCLFITNFAQKKCRPQKAIENDSCMVNKHQYKVQCFFLHSRQHPFDKGVLLAIKGFLTTSFELLSVCWELHLQWLRKRKPFIYVQLFSLLLFLSSDLVIGENANSLVNPTPHHNYFTFIIAFFDSALIMHKALKLLILAK